MLVELKVRIVPKSETSRLPHGRTPSASYSEASGKFRLACTQGWATFHPLPDRVGWPRAPLRSGSLCHPFNPPPLGIPAAEPARGLEVGSQPLLHITLLGGRAPKWLKSSQSAHRPPSSAFHCKLLPRALMVWRAEAPLSGG